MIKFKKKIVFIKIPDKCILRLFYEIKLNLKIHQVYENLIII